jgi:hypothetical protein
MASAVVIADLESAVVGYGVFCELWPKFVRRDGELQKVGLEVELIGSHTPEITHIDPECLMCSRVRTLLLAVARHIIAGMTSDSQPITCSIDSHTNSILCLPAQGNRSFVWVSLNIFWSEKARPSLEADMLCDIKDSLNKLGIRQR